jgi:nitroimidazol reductase NimA-like FMN-containing flavoprotein (pyridoxamine 5'-phosphate oxidase superfamily)
VKVIRDRPGSVDLDEFLLRPLFGYLATASDAGPRVSPVWFLWDEETVWIIGNRETDSFPTRITQDPRSAFAIVDFDRNKGLVHHVGMRGRARIVPFDKERAKRLLDRYLGKQEDQWDAQRFIEPLDDPDNVFIRFEPETVVARDQSFRSSPDV